MIFFPCTGWNSPDNRAAVAGVGQSFNTGKSSEEVTFFVMQVTQIVRSITFQDWVSHCRAKHCRVDVT